MFQGKAILAVIRGKGMDGAGTHRKRLRNLQHSGRDIKATDNIQVKGKTTERIKR